MIRRFRLRRHSAVQQPPQPIVPTPAWHPLISPAFRLVMFGAIACYVQVLLSQGQTLAAAVFSAVMIAVGAQVSTVFGRFGPARA